MTELTCPACAAVLPSAFPGASIACVCGHRVDVADARGPSAPRSSSGQRSARASSPEGAGPYRSGADEPLEHVGNEAPCPYCGNACPAMVRLCPHCDVRLDNVRCQRCFSLQAPGAFSCARCRHPLELEPLLDATDAPCPRCIHPLEAAPGEGQRAHECPRCGGMFVPREALAEILCSAEIGGALREGPTRSSPSGGWSVEVGATALDEVRYVPCPLCHATMNRVNFGKVSGVIVDVCKMHGTWFDAGELTRVVAFAAMGGLEKTRAREKQDRRDVKDRASDLHAQLGTMEGHEGTRARLDLWREFLNAIFTW